MNGFLVNNEYGIYQGLKDRSIRNAAGIWCSYLIMSKEIS